MVAKLEHLKEIIRNLGTAGVAFSGGVDSTFLLMIASETIPGRVYAMTARSELVPEEELELAKQLILHMKVPHYLIDFAPLEMPFFVQNSAERCYHCKKAIYSLFWRKANELNLKSVADGTNSDDKMEFRPGLKAATELLVRSPLAEADLSKAEIRSLSRKLGLPTWDKPSSPCIATRFPYGHKISAKDLERVKKAEAYLKGLGYKMVRVRSIGDRAIVEIEKSQTNAFVERDQVEGILRHICELGFSDAGLDPDGYRSGRFDT